MHTPFSIHSGGVLALNDLRLQVNLGVPEEERRVKQQISVSFRLYFEMLPAVCQTDNPYDISCYHQMSEHIKLLCSSKEFKTLEYLAQFLYSSLKENIGNGIKFRICVEKCKPPVEGVFGTTSFECGDDV